MSAQKRLKAIEESTRRQETQNAKILILLEELLERPSVNPEQVTKLIGVHINDQFCSLLSSYPNLLTVDQGDLYRGELGKQLLTVSQLRTHHRLSHLGGRSQL